MELENKFEKIKSIEDAMARINDGIVIMMSGFGGMGTSKRLVDEIIKKNVKDMTMISIDGGDLNGVGPVHIIGNKQVKKLITTHIGTTPVCGDLMLSGEMEIEFCPQGTFSERIRAGAAGIPAILTDIGVDTLAEEGKPTMMLDGRKCIVEKALKADVAIIYAKTADEYGNLIYNKSARGLNHYMAAAADLTIVDAEEIVPFGSLDPQEIMTPGVYVDMIVHGGGEWNWIWRQEK